MVTLPSATASIVPTAAPLMPLTVAPAATAAVGGSEARSIWASSCAWVMANSSLPLLAVKLDFGQQRFVLVGLDHEVGALDGGDRADRRAGGVDDLHADVDCACASGRCDREAEGRANDCRI